jgi:hypothetical protein
MKSLHKLSLVLLTACSLANANPENNILWDDCQTGSYNQIKSAGMAFLGLTASYYAYNKAQECKEKFPQYPFISKAFALGGHVSLAATGFFLAEAYYAPTLENCRK